MIKFKVLFFVFYIFCSNLSYSQNINCYESDSLNYKKLLLLMKNDSISASYWKYYRHSNSVDNICALIIYTKIFDTYLQKGIQPLSKFKFLAKPFSYDPTLYTESEINKMREAIHVQSFHINFLEFGEQYKREVLDNYTSNKKLSLEADVNKILTYGVYYDIKTLKKILLGEYNLNRDNYYKEFYEKYKKN